MWTRFTRTIAEFLPLIRVHDSRKVQVNGRVCDPPAEERRLERLIPQYHRRPEEIFGWNWRRRWMQAARYRGLAEMWYTDRDNKTANRPPRKRKSQ